MISTCLLALLPAFFQATGPAKPSAQLSEAYDPMQLATGSEVQHLQLIAKRGEREIPLLVYLPVSEPEAKLKRLPVVLFSHGLGGSRQGCAYLGEHWAARGFAAVFMQHAGSDEAVWKELRPWKRMWALKRAANAENAALRCQDVSSTIDALEGWNLEPEHALLGRLDLEHLAMSGHSFGAVTTQMVCGQNAAASAAIFTDKRIDAALVLSPSPPKFGSAKAGLRDVFVPMLLITGSLDKAPIGGVTPEQRREVFDGLPNSHERFELMLDGADHMAFTQSAFMGKKDHRNPKHHTAILSLSSAFLDAYLREDVLAKNWLMGTGPRSVLETADGWRLALAKQQ